MTTDSHERQKELAGRIATFAWIGSCFILVLTESPQPGWIGFVGLLAFGLFFAVLVLGGVLYAVQRIAANALTAGRNPTPATARIVMLVNYALAGLAVALTFIVARWAYLWIVAI